MTNSAFQMQKSKHKQQATTRLLLVTYEENFFVDFLVFSELAVMKILEEKKKLSRTRQENQRLPSKLELLYCIEIDFIKSRAVFR